MKLNTHYIFSAGAISLTLSFIKGVSFLEILAVSFIVSVVANRLIDGLGHEEAWYQGKRYPRRTPTTHTVPRSVVWGLFTVLPIIVLAYFFLQSLNLIISLIIAGIIVGPTHMILDIFTQAGIYKKVNGEWRRVAFAHLPYNSAIGNGIATILGLIMFMVAFNHTLLFIFQ